jgi:TolB-like protein/tetratricopeptide (TPR) repeat protein
MAALLIVGTVAYAVWGRHKGTVGAETIGKRKMLAVLPLENLGAPDDEYFADGLSEAINTQLGGIHGLGVIARQSTIGFRKTTKSPQFIGRELGVEYILGGTVRWEKSPAAPSRVRVSTALVRASDATQLWARQYDTVVAGVFGVESNLAEKVAGALGVALADPERRALAVTPTESPEAHELYLRGRFMVRKGTAPDVRRGLELYREAVAKDSHYAAAWAGIAQAWLSLGGDVAPRQDYPQVRTAALVALKIDSTLAEAHTALGAAALYYEWDFAAARRELLRAIALNASDVTAYSVYADLVGVQGHVDSALALLRQARALDPLSPDARLTFARWLVFAGQYDEALQEATSFIDIDPRDAHAMRGYALLGAGRLREALDEYRMDSVDFVGPVAARLGRRDQARRLVSRLIGERRTRYVQADAIAGLYANLGDRDAAFAWLDSAYAERSINMIFLSLGPILEPIRGDPRFTALKKRVGLP